MDNLISLLFYFAIFAVTALLVYIGEKKNRRVVVLIGLIIPVIVAGLRYMVGIDYENYIRIVNTLQGIPLKLYLSSYVAFFEPSSFLFAKISTLFSNNSVVFFSIYSALTIFPFYFAIRKIYPKKTWLAVFFFLAIFYSPSLNAVRQCAAVSVAFFAIIDYYYKTRPSPVPKTKFIIFIALASMLHISAICTLLIPLINALSRRLLNKNTLSVVIKCSLITIALIFIAAFVVANINYIPLLNKYSYVLVAENYPKPNLIPKLFPIIIATVFLSRVKKTDKYFMLFYITAYVALAMSALGFIIPYGYRLADYFSIYQIPLFLGIINNSYPKKRQNIYIIVLIAYGIIYFLYSVFLNDSHGILPYQFIFLS